MPEKQPFDVWFKQVRNKRVPLVAIVSPDVLACEKMVGEWCRENAPGVSVIGWDCITGFSGKNVKGEQWAKGHEGVFEPGVMVSQLGNIENETVVIVQNIDMWLGEGSKEVVQGLLNVREVCESRKSVVVMVGGSVQLPGNLAQDVVVWEEGFPGDKEYREIIAEICTSAKLTQAVQQQTGMSHAPIPEGVEMQQCCDALRGLSRFAARQQVALSVKASGVDRGLLWQHKKQMIDATAGLTIFIENPGFSEMGGLEELKDEMRLIFGSKRRPKAIVQIDEGEKSLAGAESDTSGVSQDYMQVLLTHLQDTKAQGEIHYGVSGSGKTFSCHAIAGEFGVPLIRLDINACKGSLVGESEANLRRAIRIIEAIAGGEALWILTCNRVDNLKPEFKARLDPIWFFDKPDEQEQLSIWSICRKKYDIAGGDALPIESDLWVGREIEKCCRRAWQFGISLQDAARRIVPVMVQGREVIMKLQMEADGKYLSPSYSGVYRVSGKKDEGRSIQVGE